MFVCLFVCVCFGLFLWNLRALFIYLIVADCLSTEKPGCHGVIWFVGVPFSEVQPLSESVSTARGGSVWRRPGVVGGARRPLDPLCLPQPPRSGGVWGTLPQPFPRLSVSESQASVGNHHDSRGCGWGPAPRTSKIPRVPLGDLNWWLMEDDK